MTERDARYSLSELITRFGDRTPKRLMLEMMIAPNRERQREIIEMAIDFISAEMVKSRQAYQGKSEDELTIYIVTCLRSMGFQATHDAQFGGHCDIAVEGSHDFLWIAEAKIYRGKYGWLIDGMQQLLTRYATGLDGQDTGELLIYCYSRRAKKVADAWEERLLRKFPKALVCRCEADLDVIRSTHTHEGTGRSFRVRHKTIPLYFNPKK